MAPQSPPDPKSGTLLISHDFLYDMRHEPRMWSVRGKVKSWWVHIRSMWYEIISDNSYLMPHTTNYLVVSFMQDFRRFHKELIPKQQSISETN